MGIRLDNYTAVIAPTVNDDLDLSYEPGSKWIDVTAKRAYVCLDNTNAAAVWFETTDGKSGTDVTGATYNVLVTDRLLRCARAGVIAVTLPAVATAGDGWRCTVKDWGLGATANTITIDGDANIDGAATATLTVDGQSITFETDGTTWGIV